LSKEVDCVAIGFFYLLCYNSNEEHAE